MMSFIKTKIKKVFMMSTHDPEQHEDYINRGLINKGIQLGKDRK